MDAAELTPEMLAQELTAPQRSALLADVRETVTALRSSLTTALRIERALIGERPERTFWPMYRPHQ